MKPGSFLFLLLFLATSVVFGQLEKGGFFVQGSSSIGFYAEKYTYIAGGTSTESSKSSHFGFRPKAGYFVIENLPVGLAINVSTYKTKHTGSSDESSSYDLTFGPFVRYYFAPQDKLKPMAEVSLNFGSSKSKSTYSNYTSEKKYGVMELNLGAGASYFITDHLSFDLLLSYYIDKDKLKSESSNAAVKSAMSSELSTDKYSGVQLNIGVVVTIP